MRVRDISSFTRSHRLYGTREKACGCSEKVIIYTYQEGMATSWWKQIETSLTWFSNLQVIHLEIDGDIEALAKRAMSLQASIFDGELTLIKEEQSVVVREKIWMNISS